MLLLVEIAMPAGIRFYSGFGDILKIQDCANVYVS